MEQVNGVYQKDESEVEEIRSDKEIQIAESNKLIEATLTALETGSLTPLIKQELKYTILSKRISEGKDELKVTFDTPVKSELTPEEIVKAERRREQNRRAARKFRRKRKENNSGAMKRIKTLKSKNVKLVDELWRLKTERRLLLESVNDHMTACSSNGHS